MTRNFEQAQVLREALGDLMRGLHKVGIELEGPETSELIADAAVL